MYYVRAYGGEAGGVYIPTSKNRQQLNARNGKSNFKNKINWFHDVWSEKRATGQILFLELFPFIFSIYRVLQLRTFLYGVFFLSDFAREMLQMGMGSFGIHSFVSDTFK